MAEHNKTVSPGANQKETAFQISSIHKNNSPALNHQALALWPMLKHDGAIDTLEARRRGINHPAGRVKDLRNKNVAIKTHWTNAISQSGKVVKVALYLLVNNPQLSLFDTPQQHKEVSR
jgi:hypothetical protein